MKQSKRLHKRPYNLSDRALRMKIFERYADADMKIETQLKAMQALFDWIKGGKATVAEAKATLKLVSSKP